MKTLLITVGLLLATTAAFGLLPPNAAFITMTGVGISMEAIDQVISTAAEGGGHIYHVMPVHTEPGRVLSGACMIGTVLPGHEADITGLPSAPSLYRGVVDLAIVEPMGEEAVFAAGAWNFLFEGGGEEEPLPGMEPLPDDARGPLPPESPPGLKSIAPLGAYPGPNATSEFMIGKVAIGVVLPESGTGGTENWSNQDPSYPGQDRRQIVYNKIVAGANWWGTRGGTPANLTFYYDQRFNIATTFEPITIASTSDGTWISNVLTNMGVPAYPSHFTQANYYANSIRSQYGTDWAFAVFVADSLKDTDGRFPDNWCAYAWLYGPYMVMTYDNIKTAAPYYGWGIARMHLVFSHEMGHIFGAPDEYAAPTCTCTNYGYLGVVNGNCINCVTPPQAPCVMASNVQQLCTFTPGHVGWRDTDADGKPDPIDTTPSFQYSGLDYTLLQGPYWWQSQIRGTGRAQDNPYPSTTRTPVTINSVSVRYNVDGGLWADATPYDGKWDYSYEDFTFLSSSVSDGPHNVTMRVKTSANNTADATHFIIVDTTPPPSPPVSATILEAPYSGPPVQATITWVTGPPDLLSGTMAHRVGIGTTPTDPGIPNWLAQSTVLITDPNQRYVFLNVPAVHARTYYAYVGIMNGAGLVGPTAVSLPMTVDTTPPVGPTSVSDTGAWTSLPDRLSFSWPAATEDISGISDYVLGIRDDLNNWLLTGQSTAGQTNYTAMGLLLVKGRKYFGEVTPINGARMGSTSPTVSDGILAANPHPSISAAKQAANMGDAVGITGVYVTASGSDQPGVIYTEQGNRSSGIRTDSGDTLSWNQLVEVGGILLRNGQNELYLSNSEVAPLSGTGTIRPLGMSGRSLFGGPFGLQPGTTGGAGLNTTGLYVTIWGNVTYASPNPPYYFVVNDGSGVFDPMGFLGIGVRSGSIAPPNPPAFVRVRGICSYESGIPVILLRQSGDWW